MKFNQKETKNIIFNNQIVKILIIDGIEVYNADKQKPKNPEES